MKTLITPNLIKFTFSTVVLTIIFRYGLSTSITNQNILAIITSSVVYGILMWITGWYFGKKENDFLPIYDIGFRFHLTTFLAHNVVSILWFKFGFQSEYESINIVYITALIWSVFLIFHFIYFVSKRKGAIKNLNRDDLFE